MKQTLLCLAILVLLASCAASSVASNVGTWEPVVDVAVVNGHEVTRFYDPESGVTCYQVDIETIWWGTTALSCVETGK